jgi:hypothetical protein
MSSQQDQPYRSGQPYVRESGVDPRPFALPVADRPAAPGSRPPRPRAWSSGRARTLRALLVTGMSIVLLAGLGVTATFSSQPTRVLVVESFDRPAATTWGTPDIGRPWMYPAGRAGVALVGGRGVMSLAGRGSLRQTMLDTSVRDVSVQFDVSLDRMTGGSGVQVMALLRQTQAGMYQARVRIGREGRVWLSAVKISRDGSKRRLGKALAIPGSRYRNGHSLTVRAQAVKAAPTQIRMMVWPTGRAPRKAWQLVRNDRKHDFDVAGRAGLRAQITPKATRPNATVRFDNVRVNRALGVQRVGVTRTVTTAKKSTVQDTSKPRIAPTPTPAPVTVPAPTNVEYTDYTLPKEWDGYVIDHTGVKDSTPGVQAWIAAHAGGADANHHVRLIFPAGSKIRINTAIALGGADMSHTTLWGHKASSSAWIRGDANAYRDPGAQIIVAWDNYSPYNSAFTVGAKYRGYHKLLWSQRVEDVVIRGFDIRGNNPNPGMYPGGGYENGNALEYGTASNVEFAYNKVRGMGGDLVRFRSGRTGHVHHNYVLNTGRMGVTAVINAAWDVSLRSDHVFEYNTIDRAGYWGIDIEPEDESTSSMRKFTGLTVRYNRWGTFASTGVGGGFAVIGGTATPDPDRHIADIKIYGNVIDGYGYGDYAGNKRDLWILVAHSISDPHVATGQDPRPQNIVIRDNAVTHGAKFSQGGAWPRPLTAKYTDTLVIKNNQANFSGDWADLTGSTDITESGNS